MAICNCYTINGAGIGVCKDCGLETCHRFFGCFVSDPNHHCNNRRYHRL